MKFIIALLALVLLSCVNNKNEIRPKKENFSETTNFSINQKNEQKDTIPVYPIKVVRTIPHDTLAFTQGFFFHDGFLYESTGQYGRSSLRKINPFTGKVEKKIDIEAEYFGEGVALHNGKIFWITWQNGVCFVFDLQTFRKEKEISYAGEGWGITNYDKNFLVVSDGTNALKVVEPSNFKILNTILVFAGTNPISNLNELENIEGDIWANIWMQDKIAVIDRLNGKVKYFVDVSPLWEFVDNDANIDVVNGIAYDSKSRRIYLTGKLWKYIFEVVVEKKDSH